MPPKQDGYHPIESVFQEINLYDEIKIEPANQDQHEIDFFDIKGAKINIENSSIKKVLAYCLGGNPPYFHIVVNKKIPMGSGLGGASSNAAAVLTYLKKEGLITTFHASDIASSIGADVPFFLQGGRCFVEGIGDRVYQESDQEKTSFLLIIPVLHVSTKEMYQALDQARSYSSFGAFNKEALDYHNDFQDLVWEKYSIYKKIEEVLRGFGLPLYLSGSGAACYAPLIPQDSMVLTDIKRALQDSFDDLLIHGVQSL